MYLWDVLQFDKYLPSCYFRQNAEIRLRIINSENCFTVLPIVLDLPFAEAEQRQNVCLGILPAPAPYAMVSQMKWAQRRSSVMEPHMVFGMTSMSMSCCSILCHVFALSAWSTHPQIHGRGCIGKKY